MLAAARAWFARRGREKPRRWWAPEVIQTSTMDCGPAALKCLLEGFHIHASYGRLREACQTSIDGSSIDMIEIVARQLGLDAEQVMLPRDCISEPGAAALPALAVVRSDTAAHFVIVWRRIGRWLQIMDPGAGRRWTTWRRFTGELLLHEIRVSATDWLAWAHSPEGVQIVADRLQSLGAAAAIATQMIECARRTNEWRSMAALDAAVRMMRALVAAGGVRRGADAIRLLDTLLARTALEPVGACVAIPDMYWSVTTADGDDVTLRGAVLMRVRGRAQAPSEQPLTVELSAALKERPTHPLRELWALIRNNETRTAWTLLGALGVAAIVLMAEALLFRGLIELADDLNVAGQRVAAYVALLCFVLLLSALELPIISNSLRLGRRLDASLRLRILQKLPRLSERYFRSRPVSDVAERAHTIHRMRALPDLVARMARSGWMLLFTLIGIFVIDPASAALAIAIAFCAVVPLIAAQPWLSERDLRARTHAGALQTFYLDALLGIVPIRTHSAERAVRREHEALLAAWMRAAGEALTPTLFVKALQSLVCLSLAAGLLMRHVAATGVTGDLLLLVYWVLKMPAIGESLALAAALYSVQHNTALRLLELIKAPEENDTRQTDSGQATAQPREEKVDRTLGPHSIGRAPAVAIDMQDLDVAAAGHAILVGVRLSVRAGEHVAIVGPSGAGKSSLLGVLLGWHQAAAGAVRVDGETLTSARIAQLRSETAWLDPAVQLWNRSLLDNLRYSSTAGPYSMLGRILDNADLEALLANLPHGLQSVLAEGGASVSGGEGQRLRLGRALWQQQVRLALLDEPFRGLDREQRHQRMAEVRRIWRDATLLCVTHDVGETRAFPRVLVIENGRIVEDGRPEDLAAATNSRYRSLLAAEESLRFGLWNAASWRRLWLADGRLREEARALHASRSVAGRG